MKKRGRTLSTFLLLTLTCLLLGFSEQKFVQFLNSYVQHHTLSMYVKRISKNNLLNKETVSTGRFLYSQGQWRWDVESPRKASLVYKGKDFELEVLSQKKVHNVPKGSQSNILALLFQPKDFFKHFKYVKTKKKGRAQIHIFTSTKPAINRLSIKAEKERLLSLDIQWKQDRGWERYEFTHIHFNRKFEKNWLNTR